MNSQEELLSMLDLLDLDEEIIDNKLKSIMARSNYTNKHLTNALYLLRYKYLVNIQETTECDNSNEYDFAVKLIKNISVDTVDNVCKITNIVLKLNTDTLISYSEHLLHQILGNINLEAVSKNADSEIHISDNLLYFKICDSILDAIISKGLKLSLVFLETPLEEIIGCVDETLKIHFITNSVPKIVQGIDGYDILGKIWCYLEMLSRDKIDIPLKVLSSLSDYYLPASINKDNVKYKSTLVYSNNFWNIILNGLKTDDPSLRKISIYLSKRAIDYGLTLKTNINVKIKDQLIFIWDHSKCEYYKNQWDNFFILIDSLEEKQSNIVLPSLQLFDTLSGMGNIWLNCAYKIALRHDNSQVRLKCIEYRIKTNINNDSEAVILLEALNDINFYDNSHDCNLLKEKLSKLLQHENNLILILKSIPLAHLSPVPFYHLSNILANLNIIVNPSMQIDMCQIIIDILKVSCNIITVREAVHINIVQFIAKSCVKLHWKEISGILTVLHWDSWILKRPKNHLYTLIHSWKFNGQDEDKFYRFVLESHLNIDIGIMYLDNPLMEKKLFVENINKKIQTIQDVVNRQYSNKMECLNDVIYLIKLYFKCSGNIILYLPKINDTILQYIFCLLSSDTSLSIEETKSLFDCTYFDITHKSRSLISQLYKNAILCLQDSNTAIGKILLSILIVNNLSHNNDFINKFGHEMLGLKDVLGLVNNFNKKELNSLSLGRLRNVLYETHCKIVYAYLSSDNIVVEQINMYPKLGQVPYNTDCENELKTNNSTTEIIYYDIDKVIECGGFGCLEWILKIINKTFNCILMPGFDLSQFINRIWREIEELKSSNHYLPSMMEFVKLITQKSLRNKPENNNIVTLYCSKIIEYGPTNNTPLYYLVDHLELCLFDEEENRSWNEHGHIVYILSDILLYCPVPRKDVRIVDNLTLEITQLFADKHSLAYSPNKFYNVMIMYKALLILSRIYDSAALLAIATFIWTKIETMFKAKLRYHGNSQVHRTFQTSLQHLLYILYLKADVNDKGVVADWCMDILGRLPHQTSVRICLEWHIALHFYVKNATIDANLLKTLQNKNVPLTSQFTIMYWLLKRRIAKKVNIENEFEFVMDTLLSHTMGQMFNIRLLSQYLAIKLCQDNINNEKYKYIIEVINRTLEDNSKDKNFVRLKGDYFINEFDIVNNLTPMFIYYALPRLCEVGTNEAVDMMFVIDIMKKIMLHTEKCLNTVLKDEWKKDCQHNIECLCMLQSREREVVSKIQEDVEALGTIQKKYIPWKNMSDINVYNTDIKKESPSDLIVVASLIDKLPNLGGMARTSEVFGVKTYVIDSLRHLQDRQFQGLSVSAERWVDIEEVRPGQPLKDYLNRMKAEGYSVVAAEQTSTSSKLQSFKFPKKTLLLLGHEKEGIPCDLLPMMDHCVEIPQQGFVRSLNVHVTAAIFVWEYARQNIL